MGLKDFADQIRKDDQDLATAMYEGARPYLRKKNGNTHAAVFYLSQSINKAFHYGCELQMTDQLNQILLGFQRDEYEILDVRLTPLDETTNLTGEKRFMALITYR